MRNLRGRVVEQTALQGEDASVLVFPRVPASPVSGAATDAAPSVVWNESSLVSVLIAVQYEMAI